MEVFNLKNSKIEEQPKEIEKFKKEIIDIMKKYNLSISHEDSFGGFIIEKYNEKNIEWFNDAFINY